MAGLSLIPSKYEIWFSKFVGDDEAKYIPMLTTLDRANLPMVSVYARNMIIIVWQD